LQSSLADGTNAANYSNGELRHIAAFEQLSGAQSRTLIHQALFMAAKQGRISNKYHRDNSLNTSAR
jgi:hypothetical protein